MQETMPLEFEDPKKAERMGKLRREFFSADTQELITELMDVRLEQLECSNEPEKLVRRVRVGRNHPCPCGSGKKFKKCCISKDGNY